MIIDHACMTCGDKTRFSEAHDARFCECCNIWLEDGCTDPDCETCEDRPDTPSQAYLSPVRTVEESLGVLFNLDYYEWLTEEFEAAGGAISNGYVNAVFVDGISQPELLMVEYGRVPYTTVTPPFQRFVFPSSLRDRFPDKTIQLEWITKQ